MNKSVISFAAALLSASALVAATPAQADQTSKTAGTQSIGVALSAGSPEITVRNVANTNKFSDLQLDVLEDKVAIGVSGQITCRGITSENITWRHGDYLGNAKFGIGRTSFVGQKDIGYSSNINRVHASDVHAFNLPTNLLGHSQIQVNPADVVMAAATQSGNKIQYLRQNHTINVTIPIRWEGVCAAYSRNKIIKKTTIESNQPTSYITKDVTLKIKYQGDPDLQPTLNVQLGNNNGGLGGFQAGEQNFINITGATFVEGIKNLKTKCPGQAAFKVRVTGEGNGHVKIRVNDGGATIKTSPAIELVNGKAEFAFSQNLLYQMAGKGDDHQYRVYYSKKTVNENFFPAGYQPIGAAFDWTHTCIKPISVGVGLGGNGTIQTQGQQGNSNAPAARGFKPSVPAPTLGKVTPGAQKPARAETRPARAKTPTVGTPVVPAKKMVIPATPAKPARAAN